MKPIARPTTAARAGRLLFALALAILASHPGCRQARDESLPKTFPVTGEILDKAGHPLTIGSVEFVSIADEKTQAVGKVQPDGTFSLITLVGEDSVPGAIKGAHKVTFLPGSREQLPFYFKEAYKVGPGQNHFTLTYPYGSSGR